MLKFSYDETLNKGANYNELQIFYHRRKRNNIKIFDVETRGKVNKIRRIEERPVEAETRSALGHLRVILLLVAVKKVQ